MALQPGRMLLHYRLVEKLGEGGMGVVWKALDTTLDREVALKLLPDAFAADPERLARFEREAKVLASLNHPHIASVHGLHEQPGATGPLRFIAMELVPGENLAQRLTRGPLPVADALKLARQIADALEAAHERGVVHRDLKPANVVVCDDDTVKVLDFGLARSSSAKPAGGDASATPTVTSGGTAAGTILGTAAFMSPEQARGKPLDRRTDIWSFGCVLYEMLTGKRCFGGETPSDTLARILEREPDWSALPAVTPEEIKALLRRCLRKDPRRRMRDIGEARLAIEDLGDRETVGLTPSPAPSGSWRGALPWIVVALVAVSAMIAQWLSWRSGPPEPRSPARLVVSLPRQHQLAIAGAASIAVSPDGTRLVYGASSPPGSRPRLYLRRLDRFEAVPVPGSLGALGPFFSPDSRWLGFFAQGKLFKFAVDGGTPVEVAHVGQVVPGACWGPDDSIYFTASPNSGLVRVPADGGAPEPVTAPDFTSGESGHGWPQMLPGGEAMLFSISSAGETSIAALSLRTGAWRRLVSGIGGARYLSSGHLVFAQPEGLAAVAFDPTALQTLGAPVVVLEDVYVVPGDKGFGLAGFSVSETGLLAFLPGGAAAGENRLVWVDRDGRTRPAAEERGSYEWPGLSPDGRRAVVVNRSTIGEVGIWVLDLGRDARSRLTLEGNNITPIWTPDGEQIFFSSLRGDAGVVKIFRKAADGSGQAQQVLPGENPRFPRSWTPGGRVLALVEWHPETMRDIWTLSLDGPGEPRPLIATRFDEHSPAFSPDGAWLAYVSDETGRLEVYVQSHPPGGGRWIISAGGGSEPVWSADGETLFYRSGNAMMEVAIRTEPSFRAEAPRVVFERDLKTGVYDSLSYDVTSDGRQFLMIERDLEAAPGQVNVVLDWDRELRNTVPVDGS